MGKWHKHTVKVYSMLKDNMAAPGEGPDEAGEEPKPGRMSYDKLSTGCSRRTAAGVFFELLQLKTWDYIDLDQDESYGDIKVSHCRCRMLFLIFVHEGI
jgi:cohesin complex subunit SCC1